MSYAETRRIQTKQKLLEKAKECFFERGYHETRPLDITRLAGVGAGTFHFYFEDKLECFLALTSGGISDIRNIFTDCLGRRQGFAASMRGLLYAIFDYSAANPGVLRAALVDVRLFSGFKDDKRICGSDILVAMIDQGKADKEITSTIDTKLIACLIIGIIKQGDVFLTHYPQRRNATIESLAEFLIRGLAPAADFPFEDEALPACLEAPLPGNNAEQRVPESSLDKILAAAKQLFAERGYHNVRTDEIAARAGLGTGTLYLYFKDKLDCFLAFTNQASEELHVLVERKLIHASGIAEKLTILLAEGFEYSRLNPGVLRAVTADIRVLSKTRPRAVFRGTDRHSERIANWQAKGEIDTAYDSKLIGHLTVGLTLEADDFIMQHPQRRAETIASVASLLIRAVSTGVAGASRPF